MKEKETTKSIKLNGKTTKILSELADKIGVTEKAVIAFALHKLYKEI